MHLVLTKEEPLYKDQEYLFLGKWCINFQSSLREIEAGEARTLTYPFDAEGASAAAYRYLQMVDKNLFPQFCEMLNQYHQVAYSSRYWRIVIGYWWREYLSSLYEKYICLKKAETHSDKFHVKILRNLDWLTPYDSQDFISITKHDLYNHQLFSQIILTLEKIQFSYLTSAEIEKLNFKALPELKNDWRNRFKKMVCFFGKTQPILYSCILHVEEKNIANVFMYEVLSEFD